MSGHKQKVVDFRFDCDKDVILLKVDQIGDISCHTGCESRFLSAATKTGWIEVGQILKDPGDIYVR